jgi:hypothetical protein
MKVIAPKVWHSLLTVTQRDTLAALPTFAHEKPVDQRFLAGAGQG